MPSLQVHPIRQSPRKYLKDVMGTVGSLDTKQLIVPIRKAIRLWVRKLKTTTSKNRVLMETLREKDIEKCQNFMCSYCGKYGHLAQDCPKACNNANIAQESEQNNKVENMLDLDSTTVCDKCAMMCTELQYENADEVVVVYRDQGINTEEYKKAMYGDLMKNQSEKEEEVKYKVAQSAND